MLVICSIAGYLLLAVNNILPMVPFLKGLFSSTDESDGSMLEFMVAGDRFELESAEKLTLGDELPGEILLGAVRQSDYLQTGTIEYTYEGLGRSLYVTLAVSGNRYRVELKDGEQTKLVICDGRRISLTENDKTVISDVGDGDIIPERDAGIPALEDILEDAAGNSGFAQRTENDNIVYYIYRNGELSREYKIMYNGAIVLEAEFMTGDSVYYKFTTESLFIDCEFEDTAFVPRSADPVD